MRIDVKQEELDRIKWEKSVALGFDACGSFDYCSKCNKEQNNPCACAYSEFFNEELEMMIEEAKASEKKEKKTTKKATKTTKKAETKEKKETKKATTKKTTTKSKK